MNFAAHHAPPVAESAGQAGVSADLLTDGQKERLWGRLIETDSGCWEFRGATNGGYGQITVGGGATRRNMLAHRAAWAIFHGYVPDALHVCHRCDNPPCCNPAHLFLGTDYDNVRDCIEKGRKAPPPHSSGERNPAAKLSDAEVAEIRARFVRVFAPRATSGGHRSNARELAAEFGVTDSNIRMIARGITR